MKQLFLLFFFITFLVGCTQDNSKWYNTKDEAIKYELEQEGSNAILLSVEDYSGETIVFFEQSKTLGVASVTESKKGFSWYRDEPFIDFDGDIPYSTMGFNYKMLMFFSENLEQFHSELTNKKITVEEIVNMPSGRVFNFADNEENYFAVLEKK
ncbi:VOC family protein [Alkalihalobacterium bogoriense]|uniref:VOC family protein n=1 Tax=Alkalihalobacterium bogoriense TaxID=246272 RepID=UPI001FDFE350|nr:VOC family protein [Alkalihalobacterium bogoriense]